MRNKRSLGEIIGEIQRLASEDNLACVLVHFNDTYFIDERPPGIPGMARVAGTVRLLRDEVTRATGSDRLLVLHSGDYLSPSAMSQAFLGEPMAEVLAHCGLKFATVGNHEFDFQAVDGEIFWRRLAKLKKCTHLLANLEAPAGHALSEIAFWPKTKPFLAITGIAGEQTEGKAVKAGFTRKEGEVRGAVLNIVEKVRKQSGVKFLVVLSHMERKEDKALQRILGTYWGDDGFAYVLGGHDHGMSSTETEQSGSLLSKCLSNCKTITVATIPSNYLGGLLFKGINFRLPLTERQERTLPSSDKVGFAAVTSDRVPAVLKKCIASYRKKYSAGSAMAAQRGEPPYLRSELLHAVLHFCRLRTKMASRPDIYSAFERVIRSTFEGYSEHKVNDGVIFGTLFDHVVRDAREQVDADLRKYVFSLEVKGHLEDLPVQPEAARAVEKWMRRMARLKGPDKEVISFPGKDMDATDTSLRTRSTDFGNFVADAIRVATGAQVALINSGAFRIDSRVSGQITMNLLRDVFVYDKVGAVMLVRLTAEELRSCYDHANAKGDHGAFLQVSESREVVTARSGEIEVGLIAHMIEDEEDGYRALLANARKVEPALLEEKLKVRRVDMKMVDLIARGAAEGIPYSDEVRLLAASQLSPIEKTGVEFMEYVDKLLDERALLHLREPELFRILREDKQSPLPPELAALGEAGRLDGIRRVAREANLFIQQAMRQHHCASTGPFLIELSKELAGHVRSGEQGVGYMSYLDAILNR